MASFSIELFEFALLVHRPVGLTVLFPSNSHSLHLTTGGGAPVTVPVGAQSSIVLADAAGVPLPPAETTATNAGAFVFDLADVVSQPVRVPASTLMNANLPASLNARVVLAGGTLTERECSLGPTTWTFDNGLTRPVTDVAVFTYPIGDDEVMYLLVNDMAFPIRAGDQLQLNNRDVAGSPFGEFVEVLEFEVLCELAQARGAAPPRRVREDDRKRFRTMGAFRVFEPLDPLGTDFVCAVARIGSSV